MLLRPERNDYHPHYQPYIEQLPKGNIFEILEEQMKQTIRLLENLPEEKALHQYAPGKWSIKEVAGHIADTERIMAYRLLGISRGETREFPGYDDDSYVRNARFDERSVKERIEDLSAVRKATLTLLRGLHPEAWKMEGKANGARVTVLALAAIIAGHERHHVRILEERYL
ncbi:DinB family protein [Bacillus sp. FJAT-42376]|uniref:DinB family protein n=1 Tax=Bacillus sp. FJAT-42376 TaxID=2014076 RepID=UPI000F4FAB88|nr:DinB family protein [Bacillus sp. FJAT-42376]AZB41566.1 DinB family protein [Bacillus sp. FJAT-42376]